MVLVLLLLLTILPASVNTFGQLTGGIVWQLGVVLPDIALGCRRRSLVLAASHLDSFALGALVGLHRNSVECRLGGRRDGLSVIVGGRHVVRGVLYILELLFFISVARPCYLYF